MLCPTSSKIAGAPGADRGVDVGECGQRLVVDGDQLARVLGEGAARGHDEGDGIADEAGAVAGQGAERGRGSPAGPAPRMGPTTPSRSAAVSTRSTPGNARAAVTSTRGRGVGERAAHERGVPQPGGFDVVDEVPPAAEQAGVFDPGYPGPDEPAHAPAIPTPPPEVLADWVDAKVSVPRWAAVSSRSAMVVGGPAGSGRRSRAGASRRGSA